MEIGFIVNQLLGSVSLLLFVAWVYLVIVTRKKKTGLFDDRVESELAEKRLRRLKAFLSVAAISVGVSITVALYAVIVQPSEEGVAATVVFAILVFAAVLFHVGAIGGWVIYLKGRRKASTVLSTNMSMRPGTEPGVDCRQCGHSNDRSASFCTGCGQSLPTPEPA